MEKINPFAYFYYHLYLLQLEEYDVSRFLKFVAITKGVPRAQLRKKLVWTQKMRLIAAASILLGGWTILGLYISFIPISISVLLLTPLDIFLKKMRLAKATQKLARFPTIKIIGIAGSYGKTTMKEAVITVLSQKYEGGKTPENINTPLGIAEVILEKVNEKTQVLVVEMGEYTKGDIKDICSLVKPQIGIITGINEAHLERMGSIENTTSAIFELARFMDKDGFLALNDDCTLIHDNYKKYTRHQQIVLYTSTSDNGLKSGLLGRYAAGVLLATEAVAERLGLSDIQIKEGSALIKPLPHRLEPIVGAHGVLVIDDSYNGNPEGVKEAIYVLSTYAQRRKVYITPGLVEAGERARMVHQEIGRQLAPVADCVVLIKNSVTPFIAEGLLENGFKKEHILWYPSAQKAHADLGNIVKPHDVVLFQNDWPDNYK